MPDGGGGGGSRRGRWWLVAALVCVIALCVGVAMLVVSGLQADDRTLAAVGLSTASPPTTAPTTTTTAAGEDGSPASSTTSIPPDSTTTTSTAPPDTLDEGDRVSLDGIGPVRVGMTLEEASAAAGQPVTEVPGSGAGAVPGACFFAAPASASPDVSFMVIDGRIARIEISDASPVVTISGLGVGSTEDEVRATYGDRIVTDPHPYDEGGHYLRYVPDDDRTSLIFETDGTTVRRYRSGLAGPVAYAEGCA